MNLDDYLGMPYEKYGCWRFVRAVWEDLTGFDMGDLTPISPDYDSCADITDRSKQVFKLLEKPSKYCIVLFEKYKQVPHVGIYIKGRVIHMSTLGVHYMPLSKVSSGYTKVSYYLPCKN